MVLKIDKNAFFEYNHFSHLFFHIYLKVGHSNTSHTFNLRGYVIQSHTLNMRGYVIKSHMKVCLF